MSARVGDGVRIAAMLLAVALQTGCSEAARNARTAGSAARTASHSDSVELAVVVTGSDVVHDDFADGTSAVYEITVFRIEAPPAYRGRTLQVIGPRDPPREEHWKTQGTRCRINVRRAALARRGAWIPREDVATVCNVDAARAHAHGTPSRSLQTTLESAT